jgi:hypothetical protein
MGTFIPKFILEESKMKFANIQFCDAATIARERFEKYLEGRLSGSWDTEEWEFYTFLLEQAKKHQMDRSGYAPIPYQQDRDEAKRRNKLDHNNIL